jgi:hypothetical protein
MVDHDHLLISPVSCKDPDPTMLTEKDSKRPLNSGGFKGVITVPGELGQDPAETAA